MNFACDFKRLSLASMSAYCGLFQRSRSITSSEYFRNAFGMYCSMREQEDRKPAKETICVTSRWRTRNKSPEQCSEYRKGFERHAGLLRRINCNLVSSKMSFESSELDENSVCAKFAQTEDDGKTYQYEFYSLSAIITVGYRINSDKATQFRQWATKVLSTFTKQGYIRSYFYGASSSVSSSLKSGENFRKYK